MDSIGAWFPNALALGESAARHGLSVFGGEVRISRSTGRGAEGTRYQRLSRTGKTNTAAAPTTEAPITRRSPMDSDGSLNPVLTPPS